MNTRKDKTRRLESGLPRPVGGAELIPKNSAKKSREGLRAPLGTLERLYLRAAHELQIRSPYRLDSTEDLLWGAK